MEVILEPSSGSFGLDNIVYNTDKKCSSRWKVLDGYKFHDDIVPQETEFWPSYFFPMETGDKC